MRETAASTFDECTNLRIEMKETYTRGETEIKHREGPGSAEFSLGERGVALRHAQGPRECDASPGNGGGGRDAGPSRNRPVANLVFDFGFGGAERRGGGRGVGAEVAERHHT